jgi:hypothetical protein
MHLYCLSRRRRDFFDLRTRPCDRTDAGALALSSGNTSPADIRRLRRAVEDRLRARAGASARLLEAFAMLWIHMALNRPAAGTMRSLGWLAAAGTRADGTHGRGPAS